MRPRTLWLGPLLLAIVLALAAPATADKATGAGAGAGKSYVFRFATVAPDGSEWAKSFKAMNKELETATHGRLKVKIYYGAIAGGELESWQRLERGQVDGVLSGGMLCERVMPSMKVLRIPGLFQSREESFYVTHELEETLAAEAKKAGLVLMGTSGVGPDIIFSSKPLRTLEEIKKARLWAWDLDVTASAVKKEMGWNTVPTRLEDAARAFDDGKLDGFYAIPSAALVFQWYTQVRYILDLRGGYLVGCTVVSSRAFDALPLDLQKALRLAQNGLVHRFENLNRRLDRKLLGGLFQRQGLQIMQASETTRAEYFAAARAARERLGSKLVSRELMERVIKLLADYRAEHAPEP